MSSVMRSSVHSAVAKRPRAANSCGPSDRACGCCGTAAFTAPKWFGRRARGAQFLGRVKANVVLTPTTVLPDGSYLSCLYPSPTARRRRQDGITVRVIEYTLDTPAGPGRERYRLITSLLDAEAFPAAMLAAAYHERWEMETTLDEVKIHQWAHPRPLRSRHPREVVQELYGLLLAHLAIRTVMYQAAVRDGVDPDRLSFIGALRVLRRAIPRAQRTAPAGLPLFVSAS